MVSVNMRLTFHVNFLARSRLVVTWIKKRSNNQWVSNRSEQLHHGAGRFIVYNHSAQINKMRPENSDTGSKKLSHNIIGLDLEFSNTIHFNLYIEKNF